jgi:glycosyltransferase involved in cell wall biosynthesis
VYFECVVKPLIDGKTVEYIGEIDEGQKADFLGNAAALLFPIRWPEPFGLVMVEAMACGTPVIAFGCGSVPEVIQDGVTGFVVDSFDEALRAIDRVKTMERQRVRTTFERRFTARRMAEDYVRIYQNVIATCASPLFKQAA